MSSRRKSGLTRSYSNIRLANHGKLRKNRGVRDDVSRPVACIPAYLTATSPGMSAIFLRPLARNDVDQIHAWHNDPALYETLVGSYRPVTLQDVSCWLEHRLTRSATESNWAICHRETNEHLGNFYLRDIDRQAGTCELHLFLGKDLHRGKGYGTAAVREGIRHAFETLGLREILLRVLSNNRAAIHVYEKCGFRRREGLPDFALKSHGPVEVQVMVLERHESGTARDNPTRLEDAGNP